MKTKIFPLLLSLLFIFLCSASVFPAAADSTSTAETVLTVTYNHSDRYRSAGGSPVEAFSDGRLVLRGGVSPAQPMAGVQAFTVPAEDMGVTVVLEPPECALYDDYVNIVDGVSLTGSVRRGAVIVQKKYAADACYQQVAAAVDVFTQWNGNIPVYSIAALDIMQGVYVRILIAYATGTDDAAVRYLVNCELYLGLSDDLILLRDLADTQPDLPDTLKDGSSTSAGFRIEAAGAHCDASVSCSGGAWMAAENGQTFKEVGTYRVRTVTPTGDTRIRTVYVTPTVQNAADFYFPEGQFINSVHRIAAEGEYPVYDGPVQLRFNAVSGIPGLSGSVTNIATGETTEIDPHVTAARTLTLTTAGRWCVRLQTGDESLPGTVLKFAFVFDIIAKGETTFNQRSLEVPGSIACFEAAHWEVIDTDESGGVTIHYVFASDHEADARSLAYRLLKSRVTAVNGGWIFNYSLYSDNAALISGLNRETENMVVRAVFDPRINYPSVPDAVTGEVWVFPSAKEQAWCVSQTQLIDPGFCFVYAEGESGKLTAESVADGRVVPLAYGVPIGKQLTHGKWRIIEEAPNGKRFETDVCLAEYNTVRVTISSADGQVTIAGRPSASVTAVGNALVSAVNPWDSQGVVEIIGANGIHTLCPLSEYRTQSFRPGHYSLIFMDRLGHEVEISLTVLPLPTESEKNMTEEIAEPINRQVTQSPASEPAEPSAEAAEESPAELPAGTGCRAHLLPLTALAIGAFCILTCKKRMNYL